MKKCEICEKEIKVYGAFGNYKVLCENCYNKQKENHKSIIDNKKGLLEELNKISKEVNKK